MQKMIEKMKKSKHQRPLRVLAGKDIPKTKTNNFLRRRSRKLCKIRRSAKKVNHKKKPTNTKKQKHAKHQRPC